MTIDEFDEWLENQKGVFDKIVCIRQKYSHDEEWEYSNELLTVDFSLDKRAPYVWENDWWEGQEEVEVLGCIDVDDVTVPYFKEDK